jgi:hypothetical protein
MQASDKYRISLIIINIINTVMNLFECLEIKKVITAKHFINLYNFMLQLNGDDEHLTI